MSSNISKIKKRNNKIVDFNKTKIVEAIYKAILAVKGEDGKDSKKLADQVVKILGKRFSNKIPHVEDVQDIVEQVLIHADLADVARAYILYREQRRQAREIINESDKSVDLVEKYLSEGDWEIKENANMTYSLQGLNNYIAGLASKKYWLNKIYPQEIRKAVEDGNFHIHDLSSLSTYCMGWDLQDFLLKGFTGVAGKISSGPAKHFRSALGQVVNFFYTLQGEAAGAEAFSSFDTYLAPFIAYDKLNYRQVKQALQEFLFNCNVPTRVGFQTPFTNITLDLKVPRNMSKQPVIIGGELQKKTYGEFQKEMNMLNRAFYELIMEGDSSQRVFTFPIPTINITKDFDWDNPDYEPMWEATAKYGINYFSNFINSDLDPEDIRSMCCRLRLNNKELHHRGGGLFGSAPLTGSVGVVTINLPQIGYLTQTKKEFLDRLGLLMDLARESLEIKRKVLENFMQKGLYPYSKFYLSSIKKMRGTYLANHFSTIGLVGMNEALLNFKGEDITSSKGQKLALEILDYMRQRLLKYQEKTGHIYNLEATPAEGTSYRLAKIDKKKYPDIITAGSGTFYYTNSSQLPVDYSGGLFNALELQDKIQIKYTGGTVFHAFLGEKIFDSAVVKSLIKKVFTKFRLPYFTLSPTFSICPEHGYLSGEHFTCPHCQARAEVYSRIVGYLRPVQQWNKGKREEFGERETFDPKL
ncbi:ribonucleoside triphosphate reductase [Patescibacteria group bacterium]|nr:ribonucleoside triphosphate reductase [Patescibacteria group bacterium]